MWATPDAEEQGSALGRDPEGPDSWKLSVFTLPTAGQ